MQLVDQVHTSTLSGRLNLNDLIGDLQLQPDGLNQQHNDKYSTNSELITCSTGSPPFLCSTGASVLSTLSSTTPSRHLVHSFRPADTRTTSTSSTCVYTTAG